MPDKLEEVDYPDNEPYAELLGNFEAGEISSERLEAVPQHQGGINALVERYGDDPSKCPFLNSMGEKGLVLYQRLKENEADQSRGPTMRELLQAQKSSQPQTKETIQPDNSKEEARRYNEAEQHRVLSEPTPNDLTTDIAPTLFEEPELSRDREMLLRSILESEEQTTPEVETPLAKPASKETPHIEAPLTPALRAPAIPKKETVLSETAAIEQGPVAPRIIEPRPEAVVAIPSTELIQELIPANTISPIEPEVEPDLAVDIHSIDPSYEFTPLSPKTESRSETIFTLPREVEFQESPLVQDIETLVFNLKEEALAEIGIAEAVSDEPELTIPELEEPIEPNSSPVLFEEEILTPDILQEKVLSYLEETDYELAEEPQIYLNHLVEIIGSINLDEIPELEPEAIQEIEQVLSKLFESMQLDLDENLIRSLAGELILSSPEVAKPEPGKYTIEQLNILGTREYKATSFKQVFLNLLTSLKGRLNSRLYIGRYALKASYS